MKNTRKERKDKIELTEFTIAELVALHSHSVDEQIVTELTEDINLLQEELSSAFHSNHSYNVGRKESDSDTSSKYFFKKFAVPGSISMLFDRQDVEVKSNSGILNICTEFYQNLYPTNQETIQLDMILFLKMTLLKYLMTILRC